MANAADVDVEVGQTEPRVRSRGRITTPGVAGPGSPDPVAAAARRLDAPIADRRALPEADRLADAIDLIGRQVGRVYGYLRSRTPAVIRADAERVVVENAALALVAALGLGYAAGRLVRR